MALGTVAHLVGHFHLGQFFEWKLVRYLLLLDNWLLWGLNQFALTISIEYVVFFWLAADKMLDLVLLGLFI